MTIFTPKPLRSAEKYALFQALKAGITPRLGLANIQVGRAKEVEALLQDLEHIITGGSAFRLIIGEFGSGKSFFLQLMKNIALEKGLVVANADLAPDRRLQATGGQARNLYEELLHNISTRSKPDGDALTAIVERFITLVRQEADKTGGTVDTILQNKLQNLTELVNGYDFSLVIQQYWQATLEDNEAMKTATIRWLRGEFATKTEANKYLHVNSIINDVNIYDHLKLLALFCRQAGYQGLLVNLDEMVNLYKLANQKSRLANYEQILHMLNDCFQGTAKHLGFLLGGTPEFLLDPHKGLYSYEALRSRLAENSFAQKMGVVDYHAVALHLANLTPEELFILLQNIRNLMADYQPENYLVPDEALKAFLHHCYQHVGEAYFRTPRNTIKAFMDLLSVLMQNPTLKWQQLMQNIVPKMEVASNMMGEISDISTESTEPEDDSLTNFHLV